MLFSVVQHGDARAISFKSLLQAVEMALVRFRRFLRACIEKRLAEEDYRFHEKL